MQQQLVFAPAPRSVSVRGLCQTGPTGGPRFIARGLESPMPERLGRAYAEAVPAHYPPAFLSIDLTTVPHPQGYALVVEKDAVYITGHDELGVFYGIQTLKQAARQITEPGVFPLLEVGDWPDFERRGIMLDVARDKVPTMDTLYALVDRMAEWKLNEFQLYTEHTFAYPGHEVVWKDASPITPEEAQALDAYCTDRYIHLVPNQNSFGHMNRWLRHKEYAHLAETDSGSDLCPVDPGSIKLLESMYASLLPNFTSTMVNVGCDETWTLGKGRSAQAVRERGEGRVYLDFLLKVHELVSRHGKQMQFWGDIIMQHPELIPELPRDVIAMEWGYEANHPFAEHGKRFAAAGIPFYVVPGTSSWNAIVGRTDNATENLRNAAENGRSNGAIGYLITDWGDNGHWQFLPVSYLGYLYGASLSWAYDTNRDLWIAQALDTHVFEDSAGVMGRLMYDLGNAYQRTGIELANNTTFSQLLYHPERTLDGPMDNLRADALADTIAYIDATLQPLASAQIGSPDAALIQQELEWAADLLRFTCRLGTARVEAGGVATSKLPAGVRKELADELRPLIPRYRDLWLARNRPGGLDDSAGRFENILKLLEPGTG